MSRSSWRVNLYSCHEPTRDGGSQPPAKFLQRFEDLDRKWSDASIHPRQTEMTRSADVVFDSLMYDAECAIHDAEMWINTKCNRYKDRSIGVVGIKPVAIVKIAVRSIRHGFRGLMNGVVITFGQHDSPLPLQ
jgi:hypothetical protein